MLSRRLSLAALLACVLVPSLPARADMAAMDGNMPYHRTSYRGAPALPFTLSLVIAGGGPEHFQAATLVGVLAGPHTNAEVARLTKLYGSEDVGQFLKTFTFAIDDTLKLVQANHIALPSAPSPDPKDGARLASGLYEAGLMPNGRFDVGYMIEHAISHKLHVLLMHDIDADPAYGPKVNARFHEILTRAVLDLRDEYGV